MARGKEAARAANRRAEEAEVKAETYKTQLREERTQHAAEVQALKDELRRLRDEHKEEAARIAGDEIRQLLDSHAEARRLLAEVREKNEELRKGKDLLVRNACKYVSMTQGVWPTLALAQVVTWMTGDDFNGVNDYKTFLTGLGLPETGWAVTEWGHNRHCLRDQAVHAMSLDNAELTGYDGIHQDYDRHWYVEETQRGVVATPRRGEIRVQTKRKLVVAPAPRKVSEQQTPQD